MGDGIVNSTLCSQSSRIEKSTGIPGDFADVVTHICVDGLGEHEEMLGGGDGTNV